MPICWGRSGRGFASGIVFALLAVPATAQLGHLVRTQKISETAGGFGGSLDEQDQFGRSIVNLGDLDGDGVSDLLVGSHTDDDGPDGKLDRGSVWVLFLAPNGFVKAQTKISEGHGGFSGYLDPGDQFGRAAARVGDLDLDGLPEVAVSANYDDDGGTNKGAVYILFLRADGTVRAVQKISQTKGGLGVTLDIHDEFSRSITPLGDLNGDGIPDLCVGAPLDDDGGTQIGAAYVLFLNQSGTVKGRHKISKFTDGIRLKPGDWFGFCGANLGDLDGDGHPEIALGAVLDDDGGFNQGALWILSLNADGSVQKQVEINELSTGLPLDDVDQFGTSVSAIGDLDGDGVTDIAVGAVKDDDGGLPGNPDADVGAVYVLYLRPDGTVKGYSKLSDLYGDFPYALDSGDWFGSALARLGGSPGDGLFNLAIGARYDNDGGGNNGAIYLMQVNDGSAPYVEFTADRTSGVAPLTVAFTDQSGGDVTGWIWNFSDGPASTQDNPTHVFDAPGSYTIKLSAKGPKGTDTLTKPAYITVGSGVLADFSATPTGGLAPLDVQFSDRSDGTVTGWTWDFGDGASSAQSSPTHQYTQPGRYEVALTVTGPEGTDTRTRTDFVTVVSEAPVAEFSASETSGLAPLDVAFTDASTGLVTGWQWQFGDGGSSTEMNPHHVYSDQGTYTVTLSVANPGGSDSEAKTDLVVVTQDVPIADFSATPTSGLTPLSVTFTDFSRGAADWLWDFGDGGTSTSRDPEHVFAQPGTFTVSLTVDGPGGTDVETKTGLITVQVPPPVAEFVYGPVTGFTPLPVSFTDRSTGTITSWAWSFGDATTSVARHPVKTYSLPGSFTVTLTVKGPGGACTVSHGGIDVFKLPLLNDGGFERQTAGLKPKSPWSVTGGTTVIIDPTTVTSDQGFPRDGSKWCEIGADGSSAATPPSNPRAQGTLPIGAAGLKQVFPFQPLAPFLVFDAAFVLGEPQASLLTNDFMSVDVSDGVTSWNLYYADTFSDCPRTSDKYGTLMTATERVHVDLRALFPAATAATQLTLRISVGNGGDGANPSRGYVDAFRFVPAAMATPRDGTGRNALRYQSSPAVLGGSWTVQVDATGHTGATLIQIVGTSKPTSGILRPAGEVLVSGPATISQTWATLGGVDVRSFPLPLDLTLIGRFVATQATILGGTVELCNANDLILGF